MEKRWTNAGKNNVEFNYWTTSSLFSPPCLSLCLDPLQDRKHMKDKGTRFKKLQCYHVISNPLNWVPWASAFTITSTKITQGNTDRHNNGQVRSPQEMISPQQIITLLSNGLDRSKTPTLHLSKLWVSCWERFELCTMLYYLPKGS